MRKFFDRYGKTLFVFVGALFIVSVLIAVLTGSAKDRQRVEKEPTPTQTAEITIEQEPQAAEPVEMDPENSLPPFNRMSADWGADDVADFVFYHIPAEYRCNWGKLPQVAQVYAHCICKEKGVDLDIVIAMIEVESGYRYDAESGQAYGYMQIVPEYHEERMDRLNVTDLLDPYQNLRTGIDYLAELLDKYGGDYGKALTAYNYGPTGAYRDFFSAGMNHSAYSDKITEIAERIRQEKEAGEE